MPLSLVPALYMDSNQSANSFRISASFCVVSSNPGVSTRTMVRSLCRNLYVPSSCVSGPVNGHENSDGL